jgi:hypothetical protein
MCGIDPKLAALASAKRDPNIEAMELSQNRPSPDTSQMTEEQAQEFWRQRLNRSFDFNEQAYKDITS